MEPTAKIKTDKNTPWKKFLIYGRRILFILTLLTALFETAHALGWLPSSPSKQGVNVVNNVNVNLDTNSDLPQTPNETDPKSIGNISGAQNSLPQVITDFSDWKYFEKFDSSSDNKILYPAFNRFFPEGRTLYSPFKVGARSRETLIFKPASVNRANVVFMFKDIFRCIIGNGNYKNIDCQAAPYSTQYLIERNQNQEHPWVNRPTGVKPMTTEFLTVTTEPVTDSELLNVKLDLKFVPENSLDGQYITEHFEYNVPTGEPSEQLQATIGLGVIDPEKYRQYQPDNAGFELDSLEIEP